MSQTTTIYVVVDVSYDYWRFQKNIGAALDIETARNIANAFREKPKRVLNSEYYPNQELEIIEDQGQSWGPLHENQSHHIFIETFKA